MPSSYIQILDLISRIILLGGNFIFTIKYVYLHVIFPSNILWLASSSSIQILNLMSKILLLWVNSKFNGKFDTFDCKLLLFTRSTSLNILVIVPAQVESCPCIHFDFYLSLWHHLSLFLILYHGLYHHICHCYFISIQCCKRSIYSCRCMQSTT